MEPYNSLKVHPIIAGSSNLTQRLSCRLEKILTPFVPKVKSYMKDD